MALPALIAKHNHVSEREVAHVWPDGRQDNSSWEDCLWCSVVELLNDTYDRSLPDSLTYAEKLRAASGEPPTGGSNAWQAQAAIKKVNGITVPIVTGFAGLWDKLDPGYAAAIAGSMGAFPSGHTLRRHLPGFAGGHSVYVARVDTSDRVWWCDPLAADSGYVGQWVTKAQLKAFVDALPGGGHLYRKLLTTGDNVLKLASFLPGYTANVLPLQNLRSEPRIVSTTLLRAVGSTKEAVRVIGTVTGDVDPANGSNVWYEVVTAQGTRCYTAKNNIADLKAPAAVADDGYTKATQDAAVLAATTPLAAKVTSLSAEVSTLKSLLAKADAVKAALKSFLA